MDFQGMLGDLPRNAWHIRGLPRKDVFVVAEKVDGALSYSEESVVPMRAILPSELSGSMRTSLEPSTDSNDPVDFLASGASSVTSFLRAVSS